MGSLWLTFYEAVPPPDLLTGWRGGSSISQTSRYATWLAVRTQAFGYAKAYSRSLPSLLMWDRDVGDAHPARATHVEAIHLRSTT